MPHSLTKDLQKAVEFHRSGNNQPVVLSKEIQNLGKIFTFWFLVHSPSVSSNATKRIDYMALRKRFVDK